MCHLENEKEKGWKRGSRSARAPRPHVRCVHEYSVSVHLFVSAFARKQTDEKGRAKIKYPGNARGFVFDDAMWS